MNDDDLNSVSGNGELYWTVLNFQTGRTLRFLILYRKIHLENEQR